MYRVTMENMPDENLTVISKQKDRHGLFTEDALLAQSVLYYRRRCRRTNHCDEGISLRVGSMRG